MRVMTKGELFATVLGVFIYSFVALYVTVAASKHGLLRSILVGLLLIVLGAIALRQHLQFLQRLQEKREERRASRH